MQIQMKPTDLDLHCLHRQGINGFSRTRVKEVLNFRTSFLFYFFLISSIKVK